MIRDGWSVAGIALALFIALELCVRVVNALNRTTPLLSMAPIPPSHPYADSAWYPAFRAERARLSLRWQPFAYFRQTPLRGRYITVDTSGLRVVPRYPVARGKPLTVWFLGGSTTWGYEEQDSATRPAVVARRLAAAGYDATVVNLAQPGYTMGQELVTLATELRAGGHPDVVVFWDGVNDIGAARQNGAPGLSAREFDRVEDAEVNTDRRAHGGAVGLKLAIRSLAMESALMRALFARTNRPAALSPVPAPVPFCRTLMADWAAQGRMLDAVARGYGFVALEIWQPQWQTTGRPRSAYERIAEHTTVFRPGDADLGPHRVECARVADSLSAAHASPSLLSWAHLHSADTATVFLDQYSHPVERATAVEGDSLATVILARLAAKDR